MHKQWLSPSIKGKTGKEHKAFVAFVENSIDYLKSKNYDSLSEIKLGHLFAEQLSYYIN